MSIAAMVTAAAACGVYGTIGDPGANPNGIGGAGVVSTGGTDHGSGSDGTGGVDPGSGPDGTGGMDPGAGPVGTGGMDPGSDGTGGAGTGPIGTGGTSTGMMGHGGGGMTGAMGTGGAATMGGGTGGAKVGGGTGGASTGGGTGGSSTDSLRQPPLAEWPIDEATSGQSPATLHDARPGAVNLNITFVGTTPSYAEDTNGRSLLFPVGDIKTSGAFSAPLDTGNKIYDSLNGVTKATLEVVADVDWRNDAAYIFQIFGLSQEDGENDGFMLWRWRYGTNDDHLEASFTSPVGYPNGYYKRSADITKVSAGVHIFHVVLDTTAPVAADRLRIYLDGARMANTTPNEGGHDIPQGTVINLPRPGQSNSPVTGKNHYQEIAMGGYTNYYGGTGGFRGKIYYAAIHKDALNAAEIAGAGARVLNRP